MSALDPDTRPPLITPFAFDGWHGEHLRNADSDFAGSRARIADALASEYEASGNKLEAVRQREEALWWRGLEHLPEREGKAEELRLSVEASKIADALMARAKISNSAMDDLSMLVHRLLSGLNTLSAHGNTEAASQLFTILFQAVDDFNILAYHEPEVFYPVARPAAGLPGIISTNSEKIRHNEELFERLQVAQDNPVSVYTKEAANPKLSTPANSLALRLINHISVARIILTTRFQPSPLESAREVPNWSSAAMLLPDFGSVSV